MNRRQEHTAVVQESPGTLRGGHTPAKLFGVATILLVLLAGCGGKNRIDTVYGKRTGVAGAESVNGTSVFARMFEQAGFRVSTCRWMSPGLKQYQVIVWAPDDFQPPGPEQRQFVEEWLWEGNHRTLIYIGRDYDAAIGYWQQIRPLAPPEQVLEIDRRLAAAQAELAAARSQTPAEQFCGWFTFRRDAAPRKVDSLSGPLSRGLDTSQVDIQLHARFDVPQPVDVELEVAEPDESDASDAVAFDPWSGHEFHDLKDPDTAVPTDIRVLLASRDDPLVTQVRDYGFAGDNKILVVTNGSFLLNLPLVNHEHRKLAGRLIDSCGEPNSVAFLESQSGGPPVFQEDPGGGPPTGLGPLTEWPLNYILINWGILGILFLFAKFPIFGRPKELPPDPVSDFGKHVDALGELLKRTDDPGFASEQLAHYQQTVRAESGSVRAGVSPAAATSAASRRQLEQPPSTSLMDRS